MRKRDFAILVGVLIFGLIFLYMITNGIKKEYKKEKESLVNFEVEAKELKTLTQKYDNKKNVYRFINNLKKSYHVVNEFKKRDLLILEFDNLNKVSLNSLVKKIQNSSLIIKKLSIFKNSNKANLKIEIQI